MQSKLLRYHSESLRICLPFGHGRNRDSLMDFGVCILCGYYLLLLRISFPVSINSVQSIERSEQENNTHRHTHTSEP